MSKFLCLLNLNCCLILLIVNAGECFKRRIDDKVLSSKHKNFQNSKKYCEIPTIRCFVEDA